MGFEYKLSTKVTDTQTTEIQHLLEASTTFEKKYNFEKKILWNFRHPENTGKMPDMSIIFENDGIYICQYGSTYIWKDLDMLKSYKENNNMKYDIIDFQA
jgi:hypothetical protein